MTGTEKAETEHLRDRLAAALLDIGAVTLRPDEPYTWTSGIRAPIYTDNRLTLSHPLVRRMIAEGFAAVIRDRSPGVECLAGAATGGIAHAAFTADILGLPMVYVRTSAKAHGKGGAVEGRILPGQRVAVIEDTVSTGGSILSVVAGLRDAGADVALAAAIFTYGFAASQAALRDAGVAFVSLTDFEAVAEAGRRRGALTERALELLMRFRDDPHGWRTGQ